jgi:23S rRNA (adenine2503-C2)-methyltransferase
MAGAAAKIPLAALREAEIAALCAPLPAYRARQIFAWLRRGAPDFSVMSDLPLALRLELDRRFCCRQTRLLSALRGEDGSVKIQIALQDGAEIEAALLRDGAGRKTACLSTQAGCPIACVFCKTGSLGFSRNLSPSEIAEQYAHLAQYAADGALEAPPIDNIVIMGMGEPLLNLAGLRGALDALLCGFSPRRVTVSTCGVVEGIRALAQDGPNTRLAVSVPAAAQELRDALMPGARAWPLCALKEALQFYQAKTGQRVTLESALFHKINTGDGAARDLIAFASGLQALVNLIPWNPVAGLSFQGAPLEPPDEREVARFRRQLVNAGLNVEIRRKKGASIGGACGQLGSLGKP